jgi:flavin-dependent dehydrogenase
MNPESNEMIADVAIIGGGPAGAATATWLARAGLKVVLFERERFPRFRIGESLLPLNLPLLHDLGLKDEMERRFIRKYAANFADRYGARQSRYAFAQAINKDYPYAYQVERAEFDEMLLQNAIRHGAVVYQPWSVREVLFDGERAVGLTARSEDGRSLTVRCPMVVDASGRSAFLGSRLGIKRDIELDSRTAFYAHFEHVERDDGERAGDIQIVAFEHGWFWMIPFKGNTTSVGMVVTDDYLKTRQKDTAGQAVRPPAGGHDGSDDAVVGNSAPLNDAFLQRTIATTPFVQERMHKATQKFPARSIGNFSYVMQRYAGDGYVLVGDAGAFLDPVFSSGVFLTMKSAQVVSQAILRCHRQGDYRARHFRSYERRIRGAQRIFFRFIFGWYDPAFLDLFFYSRNTLGLKTAITSVLAADLFDARHLWSLKLRINLLFLIARLHRFYIKWRRGGRSLVQHRRV